jgi:hypothetical protein
MSGNQALRGPSMIVSPLGSIVQRNEPAGFHTARAPLLKVTFGIKY